VHCTRYLAITSFVIVVVVVVKCTSSIKLLIAFLALIPLMYTYTTHIYK